ncbi:MAG: proteasome subunit alpha [Acidimicrobiales bacterium]
MSMPFYVAPEQVMKDRAEYAQKGIARGRALVAATYADGVLIVAENPSKTLHKISEIYDRVAFAGVGKYNEFDQLRVAGVRHADTKGYSYSREDVDARSLANLYAQYLGQVFTHEMKPLEVEILVAELGASGASHQLYHISYDGTVADEVGFTVLGGDADTISGSLASSYQEGWTLEEAIRHCVAALAGPGRELPVAEIEAAVLERGSDRRAFRRLENGALSSVLGEGEEVPGSTAGSEALVAPDESESAVEASTDAGDAAPPAVPEADAD